MIRYNYEYIIENLKSLFSELGMKEDDSLVSSDYFASVQKFQGSSHSFGVLLAHMEKIRDKYNISPNYKVISSSEAFTTIDSDNAFGIASATAMTEMAIKKAKKSGLHAVFANNANTFGAAYHYSLMMANKGMIGIVLSNSPAQMQFPNSNKKLLGSNPISFSIPAESSKPIVFDMSTSIVAKSKIMEALKNDEKIPMDWALNKDHKETTDPKEAIEGSINPFGAYKGLGLSMMIDILAGVLSGANYLDNVNRFYSNESSMKVGHLFIAINPTVILGEDFYQIMDGYIKKIRESNISGYEVHIPGDSKWAKPDEITIDKHIIEDINRFIDENKLAIEKWRIS